MRCLLQVACVGLLSLLAACGGSGEDAALPVAFPPAPLPMYAAGDSYTFDDGTVDTVIGAENDAVHWHNASGARFVTTRDVLLPPLAWADTELRGRRLYTAPDALFPLSPGRGVSGTATVVEQPSAGGPDLRGRETWQCQVGQAQRMLVEAGWFDAVRVDCAATGLANGQSAQRSYFYAPSIGYYVRRVDRIGDAPPRRVELVSWTDGNPPLPDSALQQRVAAIQRALEKQANGVVVSWEDAATQVTGTIEPVRTTRNDDGRWCRDFREHLAAFGRRYALTGAACRETAGDWQVVTVAPFRAARE